MLNRNIILLREKGLIPEDVRRAEMISAQKKSLRNEAESKKNSAKIKIENGDYQGAKQDLQEARQLIQQALRKVRELNERGTTERTIQDDIETLWRKIGSKKIS